MTGKTRKAYGTGASGITIYLGDMVQEALKANMMVRDYEKALMAANPQLKIEIRIERTA
jgi:hypothetical protein